MLERFGISILWLFLGCVKALIVIADVVIGLLSWLAGESHEEANRGSKGVGHGTADDGDPVAVEPNRKADWVKDDCPRFYCGEVDE